MGKTITSPVDRFPGRVTLPDYLTMPQVMEWERAILEARALRQQAIDDKALIVTVAELDGKYVTAICSIIEKWELDNYPERVTLENFPGSPRYESGLLIAWLIREIGKIYSEETDIPNASRAKPTRSRKAPPTNQTS